MSLGTLPAELILRIFDFLEPGSHFDFALTSRRLSVYAKDILEHHKECHKRYRTCTDDNWRLSNDVLHAVATDHIAAWHPRYFRSKWTAEGGHEILREEMMPLANIVRNTFRKIGLGELLETEVETTCSLLEHCSTEAAQVLLFALCSKLDTIDLEFFPLPFGKSWKCKEYGLPAPRIHNCLTSAVRIISEMNKPLWPPGFQTLRKVFVDDQRITVHPLNVAPLLLLPAIEILHICNLRTEDHENGVWNGDPPENMLGPESDFTLQPRTSTVKHICFEEALEHDVKYAVSRILQSAKELKTAVFKSCEFNAFDMIVCNLGKFHASSLETLLFCGKLEGLRGYRCSKFQPDDTLYDFECLRNVTIDISDIRLGSLSSSSDGGQDGLSGNVGTHDDFVEYFKESIPTSAEVLIFQPEASRGTMNEKDMYAIDDAVIALLKAQRCPNLRAIHLEKVERTESNNVDFTWFEKSVECAKRRGIYVYTCMDEGSTEGCIDELFRRTFRPRINGGLV